MNAFLGGIAISLGLICAFCIPVVVSDIHSIATSLIIIKDKP